MWSVNEVMDLFGWLGLRRIMGEGLEGKKKKKRKEGTKGGPRQPWREGRCQVGSVNFLLLNVKNTLMRRARTEVKLPKSP